jgi:PAS domain S-box-containing protein
MFRKAFHFNPAVMALTEAATGRYLDANDEFLRIMGYTRDEVLGQTSLVLNLWVERRRRAQITAKLKPGGEMACQEIEFRTKSGEIVPLLWSIAIVEIRGRPCFLSAGIDLRERKRAEEALRASEARCRAAAARADRLLVEVNHRVGNNLAGILGLIDLTAGGSTTVPAFAASIHSRIQAIVRTHKLLASQEWRDLDLGQLADAILRPRGEPAGIGHRVRSAGPAVTLPSRHANSLALILQELHTNSCKHGSLSAPRGRVDLTWRAAGARLVITWREADGPGVRPPQAEHVGLSLIRGLTGHDLHGTVAFDFAPEGLTCVLDLPLPPASPANSG